MALPSERGDREQQKFIEDDFGNVAVRNQASNINAISSGNSTQTELAPNQEFTGTWTDVSSFPSVMVSVQTRTEGTIYMEWSADGSTMNHSDSYDIDPNNPLMIRRNVRMQYYRTRYLNGGDSQTDMILTTFFGGFPPPGNGVHINGGPDGGVAGVVLKDGTYRLEIIDHDTRNLLENINDHLEKVVDLLKEIHF
jgi:hypothetical protein